MPSAVQLERVSQEGCSYARKRIMLTEASPWEVQVALEEALVHAQMQQLVPHKVIHLEEKFGLVKGEGALELPSELPCVESPAGLLSLTLLAVPVPTGKQRHCRRWGRWLGLAALAAAGIGVALMCSRLCWRPG